MRCAIIADIHANLTAFTMVLADAERRGGVDEVWCLGDVVGYGPDPHECIALLRQTKHICVAGNHDWAATGKLDISAFNTDATTACKWTTQQLSTEDIEYLGSLPLVIQKGDFTLVHGSPRAPILEYIPSTGVARENFDCFKSPFCLVGHSHIPLAFRYSESGDCSSIPFLPDTGLTLGKDRLIINPGGVGQPRDGNPRASYAIYDSEAGTINLHRIPYDISVTQSRMVEYGLPARLVERLSYGR
jgi:diadenosine tetraphosphatase ApaH/serine/threonine PP2A family protein phosphatase